MTSSQSANVKEATQNSTENNSAMAVREVGYMRHQNKGFALLMTKPEAGALLSAICVFCILYIRSYLKKRILVQDVGGPGFRTTDIRGYFEDSKPGPNTQLGPKGFFEIASNAVFAGAAKGMR